MNPIQAIASGFRNYFNFRGRACRAEYLYFSLFQVVIFIAAFIADIRFFSVRPEVNLVLTSIWFYGSFIPNTSMIVRRLHDIGKSLWWYFGLFIPLLNLFVASWLLFRRGDRGPNRFGDDPLYA